MRKFLLLLMVLFVASFAFAGGDQEAEGAEFIIVNGTEPESLDPHLISGVPEHRIYEALFEGLVIYDPETAEGIPGAAESWEVSADGTVYTFTLRDAVWSDGTPVTAQQFEESFIRVLDPATAAPYAWFPSMFLKGAAEFNAGEADASALGVRAIDDKTFQIELVGPLPYVIGALAHYSFAVVPLHAIEMYGDEWTLPENFVGNGPFVLESWVPQDRLTVVPNDMYWDAEAVELGRVVFLPIDDNNTGYNMFLNGEADWMTTVPQDQIEVAKLRDDYHVNPQLGTYYYVFQNEKPPLDDARVRKALSMSIDREELVDKITKAGQIPAWSMTPPMTGYPGIEGNGEDIAMAQELLAEAGYPGGAGFPTLEILYNTSEGHKRIGEFIQQEWAENLGIEVTLLNQEWATYLSTRRQGDFQVARAGWIGDYQDPNTFLDMFVTGTAMNGGRFSNARYDELIAQAATMDPGPARMRTLEQAEEIFITEEAAVMPIYYYVTINMIDTDKWGGWYENVMDYHPVKDIYLK
jgi:oligopeptide transport system substrate-binding protein